MRWSLTTLIVSIAFAPAILAQEVVDDPSSEFDDFDDYDDFDDLDEDPEPVTAPAEADTPPVPAEPPSEPDAEPTTADTQQNEEANARDPEIAPGDPPPAEQPAVEIVPPPVEATAAEAVEEPKRTGRRVGDPVPLTRREPTLKSLGFEVNLHYGLVGTGPTRLTNDVRLGIFSWWELRTTFGPYPAGLMSRFKLGSQQGPFGALLIDGGLAAFDAGIRLTEDTAGENEAGIRFHFEGGLAYARALGSRFSVFGQVRFRYRLSMLSKDEQNAVAGDINLTYDILDNLAITGGLGYAEVIGSPVRELAVNFVNTDRPGMNHFLLKDDGWSRSVTIPVSMTYGRVDSFDVDVFITPRVWPQWDVLFGAGLRWRIDSLPGLVGIDW